MDRPLEIGDVVAVETHEEGRVGYFGEVASLPTEPNGFIGVYNPDTDFAHQVPASAGVVRLANAKEAEDYWAVNGEPGTPLGPEA